MSLMFLRLLSLETCYQTFLFNCSSSDTSGPGTTLSTAVIRILTKSKSGRKWLIWLTHLHHSASSRLSQGRSCRQPPEDRKGSRDLGGVLCSMTTSQDLFSLLAFSQHPEPLPWSSTSNSELGLTHQPLVKKIPNSFAYRQIRWSHFLNSSSFLPSDSRLFKIDLKLTGAGTEAVFSR